MKNGPLRSAGGFLLSLGLLFGLVYNVNFQVCPALSSGRLAIAYLLWEQRHSLGPRLREIRDRHPYVLLLLAGLLVHATVGYFVGGRMDPTQMSRQFHFLFYSVLGSALYAGRVGGDPDAFMRNMAIVTAAQAGMILYSMFSPEYRLWLADTVVQGGHLSLTLANRPPGFTTSSGSNLSVIQSLGTFACLWTAFHARRPWAKPPAFLGAALCVVSTLVTGRTGLMLSGAFFAGFIARELARARVGFALATIAILGGLIASGPRILEYLSGLQEEGTPNFERVADWALEFFVNDGDVYSVQDLQSMPIPPLAFETLTGTGRVETNGRMGSGNDSGYIQNYYSLGLGLAILLYGGLAALFGRVWRESGEKLLLAVLIAGAFLIEAKEPFLFKYVYPFFLLTPYFARAMRAGTVRAAAP